MSGAQIAAQVAKGLAEASARLGTGQPLTAHVLRRTRTGGPDHAPSYATTEHPCRVLVGTFTPREREGTSIAATDLKVMASALDIAITGADLLRMQGVTYEIVEPEPFMPGGTVLYWTLAARR